MKQDEVERELERQINDIGDLNEGEEFALEKPPHATLEQWQRAIRKWNRELVQ